MDKKKLLWTIISVVIAVCTVKAVLSQGKNISFQEFIAFFNSADYFLLFLATIFMCGYFFFEGLAITRMAKGLGYTKKTFGLTYGAADVYFSAITPSASGGQPASAYFMISDGIPTFATTAILLVNLIMYTIVLVIIGAISLFTHLDMFMALSTLSKVFIIGGTLLMLVLSVLFFLLLRHSTMLYNICNSFLRLFEKIRLVKKANQLREKLDHTAKEFHNCSNLMFGKKKLLLEMFFWNLLQRLSQLLVSSLVFLAFGNGLRTSYEALHVQSLTVLGSNFIPVPGAMGVADYLMLDGYTILLGSEEKAVGMELLCRSFSFYGCILICGIIVLAGYTIRKVKEKKC